MKQFAPLFWYVTGGGIIASGIYLFYIGKLDTVGLAGMITSGMITMFIGN